MPLIMEDEFRQRPGGCGSIAGPPDLGVRVELDPPLSPPQYRLLELLVTRAGQVVNRDEIITAVWERE
jgi:hypothetical protein